MDRRKRKTQAIIKQAFLSLLKEYEFEKITINDIANKADISRGTVYLHFVDKYDLRDQCIQLYLDQLFDICNIVSSKKEPTFENIIHEMFLYLEQNIETYTLLFTHPALIQFQNLFTSTLEQVFYAQEQSVTRQNSTSNEIIISFYCYGIIGVIKWWVEHSNYSIQLAEKQLANIMNECKLNILPFINC